MPGPRVVIPPVSFGAPHLFGGFAAGVGGAPLALGAKWYVRVGGSNNNGGSSTSLTPERSGADGVTNGTTTFTSASGSFTQADVGKGICLHTGASAQRFTIVAVGSSTSITLSRVDNTSNSSVAWAIGGAWADIRAAVADGAVTGGSTISSPVSAGDSVYIGAGVYRAIYTVQSAVAGWAPRGEVKFVGDVSGLYTGDAGMVQFTAYLTNDQTAPSGTSIITMNGKSNMTFQSIFFVGGNATLVTAGATSQNIRFLNCAFLGGYQGVQNVVAATAAYDMPLNWVFDGCLFAMPFGSISITLTTGIGGADYDANVQINNCVSWSRAAPFLFVTNSGTAAQKGGGVRVRNHTHYGSQFIATTASQVSVQVPCAVYDSVMFTGNTTCLSAGTSGQIVEDYNLIVSSSPRSNVTAGVHSVSDGSRSPLIHFGQELQWGGTQRPFGEPMQSSPLRAFGAFDTLAGALDVRRVPRPSSPSQWDVGAFQRGHTAVQTVSVTQAGGSAIQIVGNGSHDFDVPVDAGATTLSVYLQYDSNYVGPLPQVQVINGDQVGVGDTTVPVSTASLNAFVQYTVTVNPTAAGIVTVRVVSGDTSGVGNVYADTFAVA